MNEEEKNNLLISIRDNLYAEAERLLVFIAEEMKGRVIQVMSNFEDESGTTDFLENKNLMVNFSYVKHPEFEDGSFYIGIYKLYEPKDFEINLLVSQDSKHFFLIPEKLREALITSYKTGIDIEVIL